MLHGAVAPRAEPHDRRQSLSWCTSTPAGCDSFRSGGCGRCYVTAATARTLGVFDGGVFLELVEAVASLDEADGARLGTHHEGLRRGSSAVVVDALQHFAVGDSGDGEE